jgi:hypothetical protein
MQAFLIANIGENAGKIPIIMNVINPIMIPVKLYVSINCIMIKLPNLYKK